MDLYPIKGRYLPNEPFVLRLECAQGVAEEVRLTCFQLQERVWEGTTPIAAEQTELILPIAGEEGMGYGVDAVLYLAGCEVARLSTSFPVAAEDHIIRYGFLSNFTREDMQDDADLCAMAKYHIDRVQFYDWSYRHDELVAPTDDYTDMMGKHNYLPAVKQKIEGCHRHGMKTSAYGAVYAASHAFWQAHPSWGLYAAQGKPLVFIDTFYLMNIDRGCPWHTYIIAQYQAAIEKVGFDGVHMDTYGFPKRALDKAENVCMLERQLPALIEDTDQTLRDRGVTPHLIFNNVGGWPMRQTMHAPQDAVYIEVWPPYDRLRHLRELVLAAKPAGKPVILAAYMAPFRTENAQRALVAALYASFVIALAGATQLFLGEQDAVLTQGYYADHSLLLPDQIRAIRTYQDFFVRYQQLLFDETLVDVSMTHSGWDNQEYRCDMPFSVSAEPNKLWLTFRENETTRLIGMVNLTGNDEDLWNRGKNEPEELRQITLHIQTVHPIRRVWFASPDEQQGRPQELACQITQNDCGYVATVCVPVLKLGGICWMRE